MCSSDLIATPLLFSKDGEETEDDCMKRVKKAIKNARPTNPLADKKDPKKDKPKPKAEHHGHRDRRDGHHHDDKPPI